MIVTENKIKESLSLISNEILNGANFNRSEYARNILNYPAMMVPSVQEPIIKSLSETFEGEVSLLDPFMGASNTLVTGMKYGLNIFGQDINPLSVLLSKVKTRYYSKDALSTSEESIKIRVQNDTSIKKEVSFHNIDKWFKNDVQIELSRLYRAIRQESAIEIRQFLWVTLAEVIRLTSNDRTSTFKMHIRPTDEIVNRNLSPQKYFFSILKRSISDLNDFCSMLSENNFIRKNKYIKDVDVVWGDSLKAINTKKIFDLLITSPPYGDNQTTVTYGQFSYLPLQWIPIEDIDEKITFDYLKTIQQIDSNSLGGKMIDNFSQKKENLFQKSKTVRQLFDTFNLDEQIKAKKVINFVHDLDKTIDNLLAKLNKGAYMVWTVGNRNVNKRVVQNDNILIDLLSSKKVDLITDLERDILGKRMPGRNNFSNTMSKEKILIFKIPINNE
ncbi:hypothetical protein SAMN05444274_105327 [Mariniphaga anaerophila]|uniref:Uncharacterized protein n=1 Tax=Mariniphaga anaerophila TaxID=1484053 RepID=A0A1M5BW01_9BACT|nr:hypothetical protein [Mariniphaga anaerophila]SHF46566.1 hypothetical protein SAMN05444274_105327 [Mariniphaga anaerophila]